MKSEVEFLNTKSETKNLRYTWGFLPMRSLLVLLSKHCKDNIIINQNANK